MEYIKVGFVKLQTPSYERAGQLDIIVQLYSFCSCRHPHMRGQDNSIRALSFLSFRWLQTPSYERVGQLVMFGVLRRMTSTMIGYLISYGPDSAENIWLDSWYHPLG